MKFLSLILLLMFAPLPVLAQDGGDAPAATEEQTAAEQPAEKQSAEEQASDDQPAEEQSTEVTYSPDYCEFSVTFPDEPYKTRRCEDDEKTRCYEQTSYTQVYESGSTVNFRIICNPTDETLYNAYSAKIMEETVRAMTKDSVIKEYNSDFREEDGYKQAGLAGQGKVGRMPMIYIAQLWIGKQSVFSVEAELIGEANQAADKLYTDILKTIHYSGIKEQKAPAKTPAPQND